MGIVGDSIRTALVLAALAGCDRARVEEPGASPPPSAPARDDQPVVALSARLARQAAPRIVAIGDLHGDLSSATRALRLAGAIDADHAWAGGPLVVVQTGDEIDRRDDDRAVLDEIQSLKAQAAAAGGALVALLGNHEIMNASMDFRYVTPGGFAAFSAFADASAAEAGRASAFHPGGRYATLLADRPLFAKVGDTVFVHGGILPKHVRYGLDRMNDEVDAWLLGRRAAPPTPLVAEDGPLWTRAYSTTSEEPDCNALDEALSAVGAKRMVVGHTVQPSGISNACQGRVWRIDVGMSRAFGGPIEVLQIAGEEVTVLREGDAAR
jgi:Calcineurin-like phosphoesterase